MPNSSKKDGTKLIIYTFHGGDNQKFKITRVKDNQYKIQCVHSGMWWKSGGAKGAKLTQAVSSTDDNSIIFIISKQTDGTYRIMDSEGLYVGISGAKMKDETNVILWTEASDQSQTYVFEKIDDK